VLVGGRGVVIGDRPTIKSALFLSEKLFRRKKATFPGVAPAGEAAGATGTTPAHTGGRL